MPRIKVSIHRLIDIGVVAVNAGDVFSIAEPHSGGGRYAAYIVKSIIEKSKKPGKLVLEVPHSFQNKSPQIVAKHISDTNGYSSDVESLPGIAAANQWSQYCVDIENQLSYSSDRQDFIADNIKDALRLNATQGCIILFGWNHIAGKHSRLINVDSFKRYLTNSNFHNERVYQAEKIRAHVIGRREINFN